MLCACARAFYTFSKSRENKANSHARAPFPPSPQEQSPALFPYEPMAWRLAKGAGQSLSVLPPTARRGRGLGAPARGLAAAGPGRASLDGAGGAREDGEGALREARGRHGEGGTGGDLRGWGGPEGMGGWI